MGISKPSLSTPLLVESSTQRLLTNSTLVDSSPVSHPARGNPEDVTATSSREENLSSTKRNSKERRSEHAPPSNCRQRICPLCRIPVPLMKQLCVRCVVRPEMIVRTFLNCFY